MILALAGLAVLAVVTLALRHHPEPTYQGLPLSVWIAIPDYAADYQQAITSLGTNAIPFLLKWMHYEETPLRHRIISAVEFLPYCHRLKPLLWRQQFRANQATLAFSALQASASNAVPALIGMLTNSSQPATAQNASIALAYIGIPSFPALLEVVSDDRLPNREHAVSALGRIENLGSNGLPAVPVLLRTLNVPDSELRANAAMALGNLAMEPETVVPALVRTLENSQPSTRLEVEVAIGKFREKATSAIPALLRTREVPADPGERAVIDLVLKDIDPAYVPKPDATDSQ
jgi:HEAT repeat protein